MMHTDISTDDSSCCGTARLWQFYTPCKCDTTVTPRHQGNTAYTGNAQALDSRGQSLCRRANGDRLAMKRRLERLIQHELCNI